MTSGPTDYPDAWKPRGAPQAPSPAAPIEALMLALDAFVASLSDAEFAEMVQRTRGGA